MANLSMVPVPHNRRLIIRAWRTCRRVGGDIACRLSTTTMAMVDNTDPTKVGTVIARSTCDDDILDAG